MLTTTTEPEVSALPAPAKPEPSAGKRSAINEEQVQAFTDSLFGEDMHAKRVQSESVDQEQASRLLSDGDAPAACACRVAGRALCCGRSLYLNTFSVALATLGVIHAASLSVHAIGQALGVARGKQGKHGVKQVDRLLSNSGIPVWELFALWVPYVLGQRSEAVVVLDWTDFEPDDQTTLVASLVTQHGRATPLLWMTVQKSALKGLRNSVEDLVLSRLREVIPSGVKVTVLADRGFADQKLYALLEQLGFDYVVRFRQCITVLSAEGERRKAADWVPKTGHLRKLPQARVTARSNQC